jgi:hypothetical protein
MKGNVKKPILGWFVFSRTFFFFLGLPMDRANICSFWIMILLNTTEFFLAFSSYTVVFFFLHNKRFWRTSLYFLTWFISNFRITNPILLLLTKKSRIHWVFLFVGFASFFCVLRTHFTEGMVRALYSNIFELISYVVSYVSWIMFWVFKIVFLFLVCGFNM